MHGSHKRRQEKCQEEADLSGRASLGQRYGLGPPRHADGHMRCRRVEPTVPSAKRVPRLSLVA